jgi:hypothetical protein
VKKPPAGLAMTAPALNPVAPAPVKSRRMKPVRTAAKKVRVRRPPRRGSLQEAAPHFEQYAK